VAVVGVSPYLAYPARNEPYGPRTLHVPDPWGYMWVFWQGRANYGVDGS
jgi:hypothetical protein